MKKENRELIEQLFNNNYGWEEMQELSEDILEWIKKDKERYYSR